MDDQTGWRIFVDRGGTFTDLVAVDPEGALHTRKLLTTHPGRYANSALAGIRDLLGCGDREALPVQDIAEVRIGTTVATNALLERKGERTAFITTRGFADALRIRYQHRPDIFALDIRLPEPLFHAVFEVEERLDARGQVLTPLDPTAAATLLDEIAADGFNAVAIALLHSYCNPVHEEQLARCARQAGIAQVSTSSRLSPTIRLIERAETCVADAYLSPVVRRYLDEIRDALPGVRLLVMQSGGGLTEADELRGVDAVFSGPAGGVIGAVNNCLAYRAGGGTSRAGGENKEQGGGASRVGGGDKEPGGGASRAGGENKEQGDGASRVSGGDKEQGGGETRPGGEDKEPGGGEKQHFDRVLGFDMGGTSTDVCHFARPSAPGEAANPQRYLERASATRIGGVTLTRPMLAIHTVAAGGGSICRFEGGRLLVGPESAAADPGPACYRRGGPLCITDCNLLLGRIRIEHFPAIFGPGDDLPLDLAASRAACAELAGQIRAATGDDMTTEALAQGFVDIAVTAMAGAVQRISLARGQDLTGAVLACFGGAGGQHCCAVADRLGIRHILISPLASLLSAWGIGTARLNRLSRHSLLAPLDRTGVAAAAELIERLTAESQAALAARGARDCEALAQLLVRYKGSEESLPLAWRQGMEAGELAEAFQAAFEARTGFRLPGVELEIAGVLLDCCGPPQAPLPAPPRPPPTPPRTIELWADGRRQSAPCLATGELAAGTHLEGPGLLLDEGSANWLAPGWRAEITAGGDLLLSRHGSVAAERGDTKPDPVRLEIFNHLFTSIAEQMGERLAGSALSVNIRERLDFSCALFDAAGNLIANAPHMPVHLGSMGESVRAVQQAWGHNFAPDRHYLLNSPYRGGTHLPDLTLVTPAFLAGEHQPSAFLACRGHHADIGGKSPGSMPADSTRIAEEGVLIEPVQIAAGGELDEQRLRALLGQEPWPARNPEQNLADLRAQITANREGVALFQALVANRGAAQVRAYMGHIQDNAEAMVRTRLEQFSGGSHRLKLDGGGQVAVCITPTDKGIRVDFAGTSAEQPDNFNAPMPVTKAAVIYVMRTLIEAPVPLNAGCLRPVEICIPPRSLLSPQAPAAVAAGNVETSQVIVDALLLALGVAAGSQGTMNNLSFGNADFQYYETIAGGAGAGPFGPGASGVQTHMTNSRLTDPEVLEQRFPVRLLSFELRRDSGGAGLHPGGDGLRRRLQALEPLVGSILSNNRRNRPPGLAGGGPGAPGRNAILRAGASTEELPASASFELAPGDVLVIETPGGGGWGAA